MSSLFSKPSSYSGWRGDQGGNQGESLHKRLACAALAPTYPSLRDPILRYSSCHSIATSSTGSQAGLQVLLQRRFVFNSPGSDASTRLDPLRGVVNEEARVSERVRSQLS